MRLISEKPLREFARHHADAATPLAAWRAYMREPARYKSFVELRQTFGSVDLVHDYAGRDLYVFNIGGNKYRLIAAIHWNTGRVFVRHILTHSEYDSDSWKK
jgi:mRNA interferase HigB